MFSRLHSALLGRLTPVAFLLLCTLGLLLYPAAPARAQGTPDTTQARGIDTLAVLLKGSRYVHALTPATAPGVAQEPPPANSAGSDLPAAAQAVLQTLNVKDADLRDVFRSIAHEYRLNLAVDNHIDQRVTLRLADLPVIEALAFLCRQYGLQLRRTGAIFEVILPPDPAPPAPRPPGIFVRDSLLTVDLHEDDVEQVMRLIAQQSGHNIIVRRGVRGTLTGALQNVPLERGLRALIHTNGFAIRQHDGIYYIDRAGLEDPAAGQASRTFWVQAADSLISLDVAGARIADVLREIAAQMNVGLITYDVPEERITARADSLSLDSALGLLLKRTPITYRREGDLYVIGDRQARGIAATRLLRLDHLRADAALPLIPALLKDNATILVVKEHNGLMVTGTNDVIADLQAFVREVDFPTPQILIEALVVDFAADDLFELGLAFGRQEDQAAIARRAGFGFGGTLDEEADARGLGVAGDGHQVNAFLQDYVDPLTRLFGFRTLGRLPSDFFVRIQALSVEGRATIRSRPQIATLNGHTASLSIGTTQYYLLRTQTPFQNPNQVLLQQSQRFEKIEANVVLEITPWVSASGEITADIRPEFSMPVGAFDPDVPPTINTRVLESTVRLRDGETIILGGLIQEEERVRRHKIPLLGSIPLLGALFRSTSKERGRAELVIFLTPHVFYGDEREALQWQRLQDQMNLQGLDGQRPSLPLSDPPR